MQGFWLFLGKKMFRSGATGHFFNEETAKKIRLNGSVYLFCFTYVNFKERTVYLSSLQKVPLFVLMVASLRCEQTHGSAPTQSATIPLPSGLFWMDSIFGFLSFGSDSLR